MHHLYPGLHWSLTVDKHNELVKPFSHPNLDQPSILGYIWRLFIYPGIRVDYLDKPFTPPEPGQDEPWFFDDEETYSDNTKQ